MTDGSGITKFVATINLIASLNLREKTLMVVVVVVDLFLLFSKLSTKTVGVWLLLLNKFDDVSSLIYQSISGLLITARDKTRLVRHEIKLNHKQPLEQIAEPLIAIIKINLVEC